ncbi:MAG: hypothetical protein JEZ04_17135 [Spirochaetales bacterium]|nr:hypothetical protein [Spirochaetales bacterium]
MSGPAEASIVLTKYLRELTSTYNRLIKILNLERKDIENSDEISLSEHTRLESEAAEAVISLTGTIYTYLEKIKPDAAAEELLKSAIRLKEEARLMSRDNIELLSGELIRLKARLSANKLPITGRRVYYSGEIPTMMDIEI